MTSWSQDRGNWPTCQARCPAQIPHGLTISFVKGAGKSGLTGKPSGERDFLNRLPGIESKAAGLAEPQTNRIGMGRLAGFLPEPLF